MADTTTTQKNQEPEGRVDTGLTEPGEYRPAGEAQGQGSTFTAHQIAGAFDVSVERVHRALDGEFSLGADARVNSQQAQHLAEVILGDQPLDIQQAALMQLGAFTPRSDHEWGSGETAPGEESYLLRPRPDVPNIGAPPGEEDRGT